MLCLNKEKFLFSEIVTEIIRIEGASCHNSFPYGSDKREGAGGREREGGRKEGGGGRASEPAMGTAVVTGQKVRENYLSGHFSAI